jgi:hypothetical protein
MRYSGKFGFAESTEVRPGIWEDVITESDHLGEVVQSTEAFTVDGSVIPQYRTTTSVSVLSDGVLKENYTHLKYITYAGENWTIASVVVQPPRIVIYIGEVYNGPTPEPAPVDP